MRIGAARRERPAQTHGGGDGRARVHRLLPPRDEALLRGDRLAQVVRPSHLPQLSAHGRVQLCRSCAECQPMECAQEHCSATAPQHRVYYQYYQYAVITVSTPRQIRCSDGGCMRVCGATGADHRGLV